MSSNVSKIFIILALSLGLIFTMVNTSSDNKSEQINASKIIPTNIDLWKGENLPLDEAVFTRILPHELVVRKYINPAKNKKIYVAFVTSNDRTHIHDPEICYKLQGFEFKEKQKIILKQNIPIAFIKAMNQGHEYTFVYWYMNSGKAYNDRTKFFRDSILKKFMNKNETQCSIVILYTEKENQKELFGFLQKISSIIMQKIH